MTRGRRINQAAWPGDGPHLALLKFLDRVHADNGTKSLQQIVAGMHLASRSRVNALLRGLDGALPADERQVEELVRALGGGDDDVARATRLYQAVLAHRDKDRATVALRRVPQPQNSPTIDLGIHTI